MLGFETLHLRHPHRSDSLSIQHQQSKCSAPFTQVLSTWDTSGDTASVILVSRALGHVSHACFYHRYHDLNHARSFWYSVDECWMQQRIFHVDRSLKQFICTPPSARCAMRLNPGSRSWSIELFCLQSYQLLSLYCKISRKFLILSRASMASIVPSWWNAKSLAFGRSDEHVGRNVTIETSHFIDSSRLCKIQAQEPVANSINKLSYLSSAYVP